MVRLPWRSRSNRDTRVSQKSQKGSDNAEEKVKRLWPEIGYFEAAHLETLKGLKDPDFLKAMGARSTRQARKIEKRHREILSLPFHDRTRNIFVWDMFPRELGTEVLAYVWWAKWDDIFVMSLKDGFIMVIDLGEKRRTMVEPKRYIEIGGRWFNRYHNHDGLPPLPDPEVRLEGSLLHVMFRGVEIPDHGHYRGNGWAGGKTIAQILDNAIPGITKEHEPPPTDVWSI